MSKEVDNYLKNSSGFFDISNLIGKDDLKRIVQALFDNDKSDDKYITGKVLRYIDAFIRTRSIRKKDYMGSLSKEYLNLSLVINDDRFYKMCVNFKYKDAKYLREILDFIFNINNETTNFTDTIIENFSSSNFKRFFSNFVYNLNDEYLFRNIISTLSLILSRNQSNQFEKFVKFLGSDTFFNIVTKYHNFRDELLEILKKTLLLLLNFPNRTDYLIFADCFILSNAFFNWIDKFSNIKRKIKKNESIKGSIYLINLVYYILVNQKYDSDFDRSFRLLTSPDVYYNLNGLEKKKLNDIILLINISILYQDSFFVEDFLKLFLRFNSSEKKKVFNKIFEELLDDNLNHQKRKRYLRFFNSENYNSFYKQMHTNSYSLLKFMTDVSTFSLKYDVGEYFKVIQEESLFELAKKITRKDKALNNYIVVYDYIEKNYESKTLLLKLLVFFYFYFSQKVMGIPDEKIRYLNKNNENFNNIISRRYFCNRNNIKFNEKEKLSKENNYFQKDVDIESAIQFLRLDVIDNAFGQNKIQKDDREYSALYYLFELSGNRKLEDELYVSLVDIIKNNDLINYERFIREKFATDPDNLAYYIQKGGFYSIYFKDYEKDIMKALLPVTRLIPVRVSNQAVTDKKVIYLPMSICDFTDKNNDDSIWANRNMSLYVYLGLHEFSHWFSKSFEYDYKTYFIDNTPNPKAVFQFFNMIEDYRAEQVLLKSDFIENYRELIIEARKYYVMRTFEGDPETKLLKIIMSEVYWDRKAEILPFDFKDSIINFKSIPVKNNHLVSIGFKSYGDITDYLSEKIKNVQITSSLYTIYLAVDIFNLLNKEFNLENLTIPSQGNEHIQSGEKGVPSIFSGLKGDSGNNKDGQENNGGNKEEKRSDKDNNIKTSQGESIDNNENKGRAIGEHEENCVQNTSEESEDGNDSDNNCSENGNQNKINESGVSTNGGAEKKEEEKQIDERKITYIKLDEQEEKKYLANLYNNYNQMSEETYINNNYNNSTPKEVKIIEAMDKSRRTVADSFSARGMMRNSSDDLIIDPGNVEDIKETAEIETKRKRRIDSAKKKMKNRVLSYDNKVKGYTNLREIDLFPLTGRNNIFFEKLSPYKYLLNRIIEDLTSIAPQNEKSISYNNMEGDLDTSKIIDIFTGANREMPDIYRYYENKELTDIEVIIGMDASGSTSCKAGDNLTILDVEKIFATLLGKSFETITNRVSYYAFNSLTSTNVYQFPTVDDISALTSNNSNRDGDFIRYISNIFSESDAKYKYFFLLSDGAPSSDNYSGIDAIKDTAMAMNEVLRNNVKLIYFNIDPCCSKYFEEFAPNTTYSENFKNPKELIDKVKPMVLEIVNSIVEEK